MSLWIDRIASLVIVAFAVVWCIDIYRKRKQKPIATPRVESPPRGTFSGTILTPPPTPIDRTEFLQARIAYLAHMRDVGIEVEETDESGNKAKRIRPAKPDEMIEAINIRDAEHIERLFDTWDQVQKKQREKTL